MLGTDNLKTAVLTQTLFCTFFYFVVSVLWYYIAIVFFTDDRLYREENQALEDGMMNKVRQLKSVRISFIYLTNFIVFVEVHCFFC